MKFNFKAPMGAFIILLLNLLFASPVIAQSPSVAAVLFFSPSCGHCHKVMEEDLPPLLAQYGEQLEIYAVDVTAEEGQALYRSAIERYQVPDDRRGVPMLIVGDAVLVGSREIPEQFPVLIATGLSDDGVQLPDIPGLAKENLTRFGPVSSNAEEESAVLQATATITEPVVSQEQSLNRPVFIAKFLQDPVANTLAVILLVGMIASIIWAAWSFLTKSEMSNSNWANWAVPLLSLGGIFVAGYMTYIETTNSVAICGPIGNCNAVQQSPYAYVMGFLPVGILGLLGYATILAVWLIAKKGPAHWQNTATILCWALVWFGMIFSMYLTFLEPFVIGASCAWCITSALIMTVLLLATTGPAINAWNPPQTEGKFSHSG